MRTYEAMVILAPTLDVEAADDFARRLAEIVQRAGGTVHGIEPWGKRRLAYDIRHYREGIYYVMRFTAEAEVPRELRRVLGLAEHVLRYLVMRLDEREAEAYREAASQAEAAETAQTAEAADDEEAGEASAEPAGAAGGRAAEPSGAAGEREVEPLTVGEEP